MGSIVINKLMALMLFYPDLVFMCMNITETAGYDNEGNPTGQSVGYTLHLIDLIDFKPLKVKVPKIKLPITAEQLKEKRQNGERIFIQLSEDATIKPYFNSRSKSVEDSINANSFTVVDSKF